jgi:hypothetical protein
MKTSGTSSKQPHPSKPEQPASDALEFDDSEDVDFWEAQTTESDTGRRVSDSSTVKDTVAPRGRKQLDEDLALESQAQSGGDRAVQKVQAQGKSTTGAKNPTGQHSPKRANPETHSVYGAAQRRSGGGDAQGITSHSSGDEDSRQEKVVAIRNDAKAAGRRTGSKRKAS